MATPFPQPVTAAQIGTYFVGHYYELLEQQPEFVHNFYTDVSIMVRIDGNTRESASGMLQIHSLIMSLNFTGVEIMTAHSLESWSGGVLIMVTGSVQLINMDAQRKFMQTLFLAPQENGFFVLNDIFHLSDEEPVHPPHPAVFLPQSSLESKPNAATIVSEPVIETRDFATPAYAKENDNTDKYNFPEQLLPCIPQNENILEEDSAQESNALSVNTVQQPSPTQVDEPVKAPQKHTYASILRVNKGESAPATETQPSKNQKTTPASNQKTTPASIQKTAPSSNQKTTPAPNQKTTPDSDRHHTLPGPQSNGQHSLSTTIETPWEEMAEEVSTMEDDGEMKSVYVKNLLPNISPSEIEEQFRRFGKIKPDGVVIRPRKDLGVCYAFVEFEDTNGVHNAVKVSSVEIAGRPVYIEERRVNSNNSSRGGKRGRGRGSYITNAPRGRFSTRYGRGSGQDGSDRDYRPRATSGFYRQVHGQDGSDRDYRPRATNGFYRQVPRQDRGFTGNHASSIEEDLSESTA